MINLNELIHDEDFCQKIDSNKFKNFDAIVKDASMEDLQLLKEGERTNITKLIITDVELNYGDIIVYDNEDFRIINVREYTKYGFYKYLAAEYRGIKRSDSNSFRVT